MHTTRLSFKKYDNTHYIVYLDEKVTENYRDDDSLYAGEGTGERYTAFSYTGTLPDGGTLIEVDPGDRLQNALINGIIRTRYTLSEEDAVKTHQFLLLTNPDHEKAVEYRAEFDSFNEFRENCIATVRSWFIEG
jgi:hypothetical protein